MAQVSFISASKLVALLKEADRHGNMNVRVLTTNRLALGVDPLNPDSVIDFSKETVGSLLQDSSAKLADPLAQLRETPSLTRHPRKPKGSRSSGKYFVEILDARIECSSLKELLSVGLKNIEKNRPGTLLKLSQISPRSKYIVAKDKYRLFANSEAAEKYAEHLIAEWWYGTNNSAAETKSWLMRCAQISGLKWGEDVKTSL